MLRQKMCKLAFLFAVAVTLLEPASALAIPKIGQPLPSFSVTTTSGQRVTNLNYSGKVLLIAFSTDYCTACKKAVPNIGALADRLGRQKFHVLGLFSGFDNDTGDLKAYIQASGVTYPMAFFEQSLATEQFGVISVPYFLLVDKKGVLVNMYRGFSDTTMKSVEAQAKKLLAE